MSDISFVVFTHNEEKRIAYTIRNLRVYGKVFVLDEDSTDQTKSIAESLGAVFLSRPKSDKGYIDLNEEMFDFMKKNTPTEWIYWGYTDNFLPNALLKKMVELSEQTEKKYVYIPIHTYMWGDIEHPVLTNSSYPCFYMKSHVSFFQNPIHGMGKFLGPKEEILYLPNRKDLAIRHLSLYDLNRFVIGHLRYAEGEAKERFAGGKRFSVGYMFGSMANYFRLFYTQGWKAGKRGLYGALLYSFFRLMVAVKLYELEHNVNLETIEGKFNEAKEKIIAEVENNGKQ